MAWYASGSKDQVKAECCCGWHECSQLIQAARHGAESKGSLSVWSREARSRPEPRALSQVFCPRVSEGFGIDSTLWVCLCSDLVSCLSWIDTAAIPGWTFTILPGTPLTSLFFWHCCIHIFSFLIFFRSFCWSTSFSGFFRPLWDLNMWKFAILPSILATHFSILAWEISWTEEPGGPLSMGVQRVRHNWVNNTHTLKF